MRRAGLIFTCLLLLAAVGAPSSAQAGHRHHCQKKHCKHKKKPPLDKLIAPESACPGQTNELLAYIAQEGTMRCMVNYARSRSGHAPLSNTSKLDTSADQKANDILRCNDFSHNACGRAFTYWFQQIGYILGGNSCWQAGENIAWGTGELGTVRSILSAWVHSPEHLENMLSDNYDQFGIGLEVGTLNGYNDAHVWVNHFGSHC